MAFLSATGLTQHMQESHDVSSSAQTTAPPAQLQEAENIQNHSTDARPPTCWTHSGGTQAVRVPIVP